MRCAVKDVRMRKAAASSSDNISPAREVARITTARRALSFSNSKPPAASTRRAQKAVDKLHTLTAAAVNTSFVSPTRIVRLTADEELLPSPTQLVVMPLLHFVTLARMLTCGQVGGNDCPGQLKLLEEPRITAAGPSLKLQCAERGCGAIHLLPDDLVQSDRAEVDRTLALRTYTAVLGAGMGYAAYQSFMVGIGAQPICKSSFFKAQTQAKPVVERMSVDIMKRNRDEVRDNFEATGELAAVAIDGSWSTRRNAHHGGTNKASEQGLQYFAEHDEPYENRKYIVQNRARPCGTAGAVPYLRWRQRLSRYHSHHSLNTRINASGKIAPLEFRDNYFIDDTFGHGVRQRAFQAITYFYAHCPVLLRNYQQGAIINTLSTKLPGVNDANRILFNGFRLSRRNDQHCNLNAFLHLKRRQFLFQLCGLTRGKRSRKIGNPGLEWRNRYFRHR